MLVKANAGAGVAPARYMPLIPIHDICSEDGTRLGRDEDHLNSLEADFVKRLREKPDEHPVQNPLRVVQRGDKFVIVAGNNRYLAALRAGLRDLPCIVLPGDLDPVEMLIEQAKDNEMQKAYSPLERARNIVLVAEKRGCSHAEAGKLLGITAASKVAKLLRVLRGYPEDLWPLIGEGNGRVPVTTAYHLARLHPNEAKIRELTDRVVKGLLCRDAAEQEVGTILRGNRTPKPNAVTLRGDGIEMTIWNFTHEGVRKFTERLNAAVKKVKGIEDLNDLPFYFRSA